MTLLPITAVENLFYEYYNIARQSRAEVMQRSISLLQDGNGKDSCSVIAKDSCYGSILLNYKFI